MSALFNDLDRAAGALSCSTGAANYSSQVAALQHHHSLHQTSNGSVSPTSQMPSSMSQSPLSITSVSSPTQQQSSASPTTILSSTNSPTLSSMPSSSITATNSASSNLSPIGSAVNALVEDQRALQLAFELSMVGLSDTIASHHHPQPPQHHQQLQSESALQPHHQSLSHLQSQQQSLNASAASYADLGGVVLSSQQMLQQQQGVINGLGGVAGNCNGVAGVNLSTVLSAATSQQPQPPQHSINAFSSILPPGIDERSKKSQNMTECVPVPSSEHVAEIVGRQGCKIKALRAKTNTYIKTPVRGEEPVFVVTGRKEDVGKAKREILSAAEHFSLIRASRKPTLSGLGGKGSPPGPPTNIPGQVTIQVRVPYRVVGLVVGPKGATIKHIQQQTHTYIVTPSRDKEPIFEVTGMPDNVQSARRQIEAHIALRTGNIAIAAAAASGNTTNSTGSISGLGSLLGDEANSEFLASLYKNGFGSLLGYLEPSLNDPTLQQPNTLHQQRASLEHHQTVPHHHQQQFAPVLSTSSGGSRSCSSSSSSTSSKSAARSQPELINIWKSLGDSIDVDEGLGESPNIWTLPVTSTLGSRCSPSTSVSPTDSLLGGASGSSNSSSNGGSNGNPGNNTVNMLAVNAVAAAAALCRRECLVCGDKEVTAALVPCGHNMFCMDCATRVCTSGSTGTDGICPVCSQTVIQAIRIIP